MIVLGVESSCDETGLALYDTERGLLAHALHSQIAMHQEYGGVVPELASRDHIRRALPLLNQVIQQAAIQKQDIDAIAFTQGPGLAGALLVGASFACGLGLALDRPVLGVHHLEGHLLSPLLASRPPEFPFIALLVSGGHTQLMRVDGIGQYQLLGETLDDAAGEAFDKSAKLLGLSYPGELSETDKANVARGFVDAIVDVLVAKCATAIKQSGLKRLVIAGGVGANRQLRQALNETAAKKRFQVFYPELEFCTDNGAMIAFAGAMRLKKNPALATRDYAFNVRPRWPLHELDAA